MLKLVAAAVFASVSLPAAAVTTTYTSQAAFDAAVTGETVFGFDEGNSTDHFHFIGQSYTQSGITFVDNLTAANAVNGNTASLVLIGNATTPAYGVDFLSFQNESVGISADLTSPGVTAFGFTYGTYVADGPATFSVNGGTPIAIEVTHTLAFIGFTSDTPITDITILFPGGYSFDLTSVSYAGAATVPEPATWGLMIAGFAMVGVASRRRAKVVTA